MPRRFVVIGSGPAGIACAKALVSQGIKPIVLDGGRRLEEPRERALRGDGRTYVAGLRDTFPVDIDRLPLKPVYGSTYAYDDSIGATRYGGRSSLAVGGLSSVWGAAMLPFAEADHDDWPISRAELEPHYRAVLSFVPLAGEYDALDESFPLYTDARPLRATPQVAALLADVREREGELRAAGVRAGRSRLAVRQDRCDLLGLCMLGCPTRAIWSSEHTLAELVAAGFVEHRPGVVVERFEERTGEVRLSVRGESDALVAERVLVAAGALATTRLVLASLDAHDRDVRLLDSAYYTLPAVRWSAGQRVHSSRDAGNTLAQVFVEIDDPAVSARAVHLQVYGFNDLMLRAVAARAHLPEPLAARVLQPLLRRLLYVQGYLHSDESPGARVRLTQDGTLSVEGEAGQAEETARRVVEKLRSLHRVLRIEPLESMLKVWPPGKGFHSGGSFPMSGRPGELETDVLGRLPGFARVHLADASVFPTIPAATITLPAMANAHRIAGASAG
jgi:choline dehydrogenase-like flavoprotein